MENTEPKPMTLLELLEALTGSLEPTKEDYYILSDAFTELAKHFGLTPDDVRAHRVTMEGDEVPNAAALVDWIKKNTTRI